MSTPDLLLLFIIGLVVFGPKKLPELARKVGEALRAFKQSAYDITQEWQQPPERSPAQKPIPSPNSTPIDHLNIRQSQASNFSEIDD